MHDGVELLPTSCEMVRRLNALPRVLPEFPDQLSRLLEMAHDGSDPEIKELLSVMACAQLGLPVQPLGDVYADDAEPAGA